ncbi:hypothetical protein [Paenirhodobacter enshiensis]|uniref:hypothetical protein n=1 Tax=Paenirhodobacter enshiensis TaxID=1105367 RepID=UPI003FA2646B
MDFLKSYDARGAAETARACILRDQQTGAEISIDGKPAIVWVKGASSRSAQAALRAEETERLRAAQAAAETAPENAKTAEDLHAQLCKAAKRYIAGFENLTTANPNGTERAMGAEDIDAFLDLNFLSMAHLLRDKTKDDGGWLKPSFAQQILDFAQDDAAFLPGSATA